MHLLRPLNESLDPDFRGRRPRLGSGRWATVLLAASCSVALLSVESAGADPLRELAPGWEVLGTFEGSSSSRLGDAVRDLVFEIESTGDLYEDLGSLSVGLGVDPGDWEIEWENTFSRRFPPAHRAIEPGGELRDDDVSSYLDISRFASRGRVDYAYVPEILGEADLKARGELGFVLERRRQRAPLRIGDRSLANLRDEILEEDSFLRDYPLSETKLPGDAAVLLATAADNLAEWMGQRLADTEQAALFFEYFAEPMVLGIDLGIPVRSGLFTGEESGIAVGDAVSHTTFTGFTPAEVGYRKFGLRPSFRVFYRFLRETTILREDERTVRVHVRNFFARGGELIPMKVRPEIRIFGLFRLATTLWELKFDRSRGTTSEIDYRIDLENPRGLEAFRQLLGDGTRVSWRPLAEAALDSDGVELLRSERRRGKDRSRHHRLDLFSWVRLRNASVSRSDWVEVADATYRELRLVRTRDYRRSKRLDVKSSSAITAAGNLRRPDENGGWVEDPTGKAGVRILTSVQNVRAAKADVVRSVETLAAILGLEERPEVLREIASRDREGTTRIAWNLELTFDGRLLEAALSAPEETAWAELAELLLGAENREVWSDEAARRAWRKRSPAQRDADVAPFLETRFDGSEVYGLAERLVKDLDRIRRFRDEDCLRCLQRAYRQKDRLPFLQAILVRLAGGADDSGLGYHFEIYVDDMLGPVSVSNGRTTTIREALELRTSDEERTAVDFARWVEDDFVSSESRLRGGFLWLDSDPKSTDSRCWVLRLFSDLDIDPATDVRLDLRESNRIGVDEHLLTVVRPAGERRDVVTTPFMAARHYYDIALPDPDLDDFDEGHSYSVLVRLLNEEGFPLTEEQQIRFEWPEGIEARLAPACADSRASADAGRSAG